MTTLEQLRSEARRATLFAPTTLAEAVHRLGFVQADPIRAPARAQDLILRHRVSRYRAGDLERRFPRLKLEEDFLHAHGFMSRETWGLLHPRSDPSRAGQVFVPTGLVAEVWAFVRCRGLTHPGDLEAQFGRDLTTNAWGGNSKATTQVLETLRHHGLLRVAGRRKGIRIYTAASPVPTTLKPAERARRLILLVARSLAPVSAPSLRGALALMARHNPDLGPLAPAMHALVRQGKLEHAEVDGELYLWPTPQAGASYVEARRDVRLLAPFDPLVWDRRRFEHLWGWSYRFEAYTPPARRKLGYYALPLLWGDAVIGWANVSTASGISAEFGFAGPRPQGRPFDRALEAEMARLQRFLDPAF